MLKNIESLPFHSIKDDELLLINSGNNDSTFNATLELPVLHDTSSVINIKQYDYDSSTPSDVLFNVDPDNYFNQSIPANCKYYGC